MYDNLHNSILDDSCDSTVDSLVGKLSGRGFPLLLSGNLTILGTRDAHARKPATLNVIKSTRLNLLLEKVELINACHY